MTHLKSYVGSIVLAGLLLQGCGGSDDAAAITPAIEKEAIDVKTQASINIINNSFAGLDASSSDAEVAAASRAAKLALSAPTSSILAPQRSALTDKLKNGLEKLFDTSVGQKVTSAAFDVVLNSDGVTVVMLDAARKSHTITKVMIDALDADWSLTKKMIPMLQNNKEFGEKFAALAYEEPDMARFFFSRVDGPMYNALADAMLLSNDDANHHESVEHSTNAYMGILMGMYATEYFVPFSSGSHKVTLKAAVAEDGHKKDESVKYAKNDAAGTLATDDNFVNLLADTKEVVVYDGNDTFTGHGDGNELINEKFFYSLFKTPGSTDSFVNAMDKLDQATVTELMDNIFLGQGPDANDTYQGYLNIISIGSAMYDGIYGEKNAETGTRENGYGFGSYTGAFIGFAGLIEANRFVTYGKAFMNAGYEYAGMHGVDVWDEAIAAGTAAGQDIWDSYNADTNASNAPARSAGAGIIGSNWYLDTLELVVTAWDGVSLGDLGNNLLDPDVDFFAALTDTGYKAYNTVLDGRDSEGNALYPTLITHPIAANETVYGFHGLLELAIREDMVNTGFSTDMAEAEGNFTLPPFSELTMEFAYNTAYDGAAAYITNIDATWFKDLSTNDLVREYFYPAADNVYIPSWMLAIDWLATPAAYTESNLAATDFDFNAGFFDVYVTSTNDALFTTTIDASALTDINITKVDMGTDSIIAVDESGTDMDGLYVYKIRVVSPADLDAVLKLLSGYADSALTAVGLDSSSAANVDTTDTNTTAAN